MAVLTRDILRDELDSLFNKIDLRLIRQARDLTDKLSDAASRRSDSASLQSPGTRTGLLFADQKIPPSPSIKAKRPKSFDVNPPAGTAPKLPRKSTAKARTFKPSDDDIPMRLRLFDSRSLSGPVATIGSKTSKTSPHQVDQITDDELDRWDVPEFEWEHHMRDSPESMVSTFASEDEVEADMLEKALRPAEDDRFLPPHVPSVSEVPEPPLDDEEPLPITARATSTVTEENLSESGSAIHLHPQRSILAPSEDKSLFSKSLELRRGQLYIFVASVVRHWSFNYSVGVLIFLDCVVMGIDTEYLAAQQTEEVATFHGFSIFFCIVFSIELALRLYVDGLQFFDTKKLRWHIFDMVLIIVQVVEEIFVAVTSDESTTINITFMRSLRFIYVVRIIRGARALRTIGELRTLVSTIVSSMKCLAWTFLLLAFTIYVLSIFFTQIVARWINQVGSEHQGVQELEILYGSIGHTSLTLLQAITGGIDWKDALQPLMAHVNPILVPVFVFYVLFSLFALMNVVNGVFVDIGIRNAKNDMDVFMQTNVRELFSQTDGGMNAELSWEQFEERLEAEAMLEYFKAIDVDLSEAKSVWRLLDFDGSNTVTAEEFMSGCLRLRGPAKAIDLAIVRHELRGLTNRFKIFEKSRGSARSSISMNDSVGASHLGAFTLPLERKQHGTSPSESRMKQGATTSEPRETNATLVT